MSRLCGTRKILLILSAVMVLLMSATSGSALELEIGNWSSPAFPDAGPAMAEVTVSYGCGELIAETGGDIQLSASLAAGAGGSVSLNNETATIQMPVVECTPGEDVEEKIELSYTATTEQMEGSSAEITVNALYDEGGPLEANDTKIATATVGPYLDVTFDATNTTFSVIGGDTVTVEIGIISLSNGEIMAAASLEAPEGWEASPIPSPTVPSPLSGDDATGMFSFDIEIPEEAQGENILNLSAWATTTGDITLESDPEEIPLTFDVTPLAEVEGENEEGPAPVAAVLLVTLLAAAAAMRRRR